jgi:tetratricopeptide (TPR) repeat protein
VETNPSYAVAYLEMGSLYIWEKQDFVEGIRNLYKAYDLDKSYLFPLTLQTLYNAYLNLGLFSKVESYRNEFFKLDKQTFRGYFGEMAWAEWCKNDVKSSIEWALKGLEEDSLHGWTIAYLAFRYPYARDIENANKYFKIFVDLFGTEFLENRSNAHRLGYSYYLLGKTEEAMKYFNLGIELGEVSIEEEDLSTSRGFSFYDLFAVYAFLEDYEKAFQHLRSLRQVDFYPTWLMTYFYHDPLIDKVRDDPRFKEFLQEAELKLHREQDRVKSWMETEEKNPGTVNSDI